MNLGCFAVAVAVASLGATMPAFADDSWTYTDQVTFMTFFGNGGPTSAETQIMTLHSPEQICGRPNVEKYQFSATLGAPTNPLDPVKYIELTHKLMVAYFEQSKVTIVYNCPPKLSARIVDVN